MEFMRLLHLTYTTQHIPFITIRKLTILHKTSRQLNQPFHSKGCPPKGSLFLYPIQNKSRGIHQDVAPANVRLQFLLSHSVANP